MVNFALIAAAAFLLAGLLWAEKRKNTGLILIFKAPLSTLFVITALMQPHPIIFYYHWVLAGLLCGLIGDVCLAFKRDLAFRAGLAVFLIGHILYIFAFLGLAKESHWLSTMHLFIAATSLGVFLWLHPRLGAMLVPVGLYVVLISVMLAAAWIAFLNPALNPKGAWALLLGALCFYASDVFVARDKFINRQFLNRLLGLPLYYIGQFLLAFSVGLVR